MSDLETIDTEPFEAVRGADRDVVELTCRALLRLFQDKTCAKDWGVTPLHVNDSEDVDYLITAYYPKTQISLAELIKIKEVDAYRIPSVCMDYELREGEAHLKVEVLVFGLTSALTAHPSSSSSSSKKRKIIHS